jgi:hypothetical protein
MEQNDQEVDHNVPPQHHILSSQQQTTPPHAHGLINKHDAWQL